MVTTSKNKAAPPQRGKVTHHHDQSITLASFSPRNKRNIPLIRLIPPDLELSLMLIFFLKFVTYFV